VIPVTAVVLHRPASPRAGLLERALADARRALGVRLAAALGEAGAAEAHVVSDADDDTTFGHRLRAVAARSAGRGLVVAGSGSAALARSDDLVPFVATAASGDRVARANNRFSADLVALGDPSVLESLPDLPSDNALPRWLDEVAHVPVADERSRWRLAIDVDSPLDVVLVSRAARPIDRVAWPTIDEVGATVARRLDAVALALADPRAEVLVSGRTSIGSLRWLERRTAARIRALVEERGLRASSRLALGTSDGPARPGIPRSAPLARPPRSVLGLLLDAQGPAALGQIVAGLADAAVVDSRVLLAHRLGPDERDWPTPEDRFASDLLLVDRVADPWLRDLTAAALDAPVPIVLGGHTLVGPGIRLVARGGAAFR